MKRTTTSGSLHHKPVQSSYNQKLSSGVNKLAGQSTEAEKSMAYSDAETTSPPVYYSGSLPMEGIPRVSAKGSCVDFHDLCRKVLYGMGRFDMISRNYMVKWIAEERKVKGWEKNGIME